MRSLVCVAVLGSLAFATDGSQKEAPAPKAKLWAGLTVTSPTIGTEEAQDSRFFMVSFALVNDGEKAFAPTAEVDNSKLFINGPTSSVTACAKSLGRS